MIEFKERDKRPAVRKREDIFINGEKVGYLDTEEDRFYCSIDPEGYLSTSAFAETSQEAIKEAIANTREKATKLLELADKIEKEFEGEWTLDEIVAREG